jgi:hypothetical protein
MKAYLALLCASASVGAAQSVDVALKPGAPYVAREVRVLADVPPLAIDVGLDRFGGVRDATLKATGFFQTQKIGGVWWLVDPDGGRFIHKGVASVNTIPTKGANVALAKAFVDKSGWAEATTAQLRAAGFNGTGSWCADAELGAAKGKPVRTKLLSLMSGYGKKRGGTYMQPGHVGYPGDCPFIFDEGFAAYCQSACAALAADKDDPWLLGYYTDNELPWSSEMLPRYLKLSAEDPGRRAAEAWLAARKVEPAQLTESLKDEFLEFAAERYFRITTTAIRAADPHHLVLGARFHGAATQLKPLLRATGKHCDVVSINYYRAWTPDAALTRMWTAESGRPFLITEWYAKAEDSGLGNTGGAGWLVRTQKDRGLYYQHFAMALLADAGCVGWHWFRYSDNDPDDKKVDPSNRDSNKGMVSNRYVPYAPLVDAMTEVNLRAYGLRERAMKAAK